MPIEHELISPRIDFWPAAAHAIAVASQRWIPGYTPQDLSALRVVVPGVAHRARLLIALTKLVGPTFIPPRITTLSAWLALQSPHTPEVSKAARLLQLYAVLRQQAWLKTLAGARRGIDLLPLARSVLTLCDELTAALPATSNNAALLFEQRWQSALQRLPANARALLSDEAQLVWSIWQSQLDAADSTLQKIEQRRRFAQHASAPLIWIATTDDDAIDAAFLSWYAQTQPLLRMQLDWRGTAIAPIYQTAWPELLTLADPDQPMESNAQQPVGLPQLCRAAGLEDEAQQAAQAIIDWLRDGKQRIALVAQDRVVARRIRALLERANILIDDETGWTLSTTRAAAAVIALFETVATHGDTLKLLDLLKSPFVLPDVPQRSAQLMTIEIALRDADVAGGWNFLVDALTRWPMARALVLQLADAATNLAGRARSGAQWSAATAAALEQLGMRAALQADSAGAQVLAALAAIAAGEETSATFSLAEWQALVAMQFEAIEFVPPRRDQRVVMLSLAGARLRNFDAVWLVGADAAHLPSQPQEILFFSDGVRRELGLVTRAQRQHQQLRDLAELLHTNPHVVMSWQASAQGQPNSASAWIERLQLALAQSANPTLLPTYRAANNARKLTALPTPMPTPRAPQLTPARLSASGYNRLVACPYQFFALHMLRLASLSELSDLPQKREYGEWLHQILNSYHEALREQPLAPTQRQALLQQISEQRLARELERNPAALAYSARWQKALPAYLEWAQQHEADGWQFALGEQWFERQLDCAGISIALHGRIDRIDQHQDGSRAVLDYKTQTISVLRAKLKQREDHQLAFYALLADADPNPQNEISRAHYVALEQTGGNSGAVEAERFNDWKIQIAQRISIDINAIATGAGLPAHGIESVCQYCEVRGLCRKGAWW